MNDDEVKEYLARMNDVRGHIEAVRQQFGRAVMLDIETLYNLEALVQAMDEYAGWWDDLEVQKPTDELELLELMIREGWHPDREWPDETYCDEMVYEAVEGFVRMVLETMGRKRNDG